MALAAELKEILACPKCKGELEFREEKQEIVCRTCKLVYRIEDDIPVMLVDEAKPLQA
ncbi:MAG TPA: Trm112 family protein [Myxococcales bacterium]|nr:Trm112 family protein [Myxococcales bacterium]